jgi:hypothetical protein
MIYRPQKQYLLKSITVSCAIQYADAIQKLCQLCQLVMLVQDRMEQLVELTNSVDAAITGIDHITCCCIMYTNKNYFSLMYTNES